MSKLRFTSKYSRINFTVVINNLCCVCISIKYDFPTDFITIFMNTIPVHISSLTKNWYKPQVATENTKFYASSSGSTEPKRSITHVQIYKLAFRHVRKNISGIFISVNFYYFL